MNQINHALEIDTSKQSKASRKSPGRAPARFPVEATPFNYVGAYPGSPFGDRAWRVNSDVMSPRFDRHNIILTKSAGIPHATPDGRDDVVLVRADGGVLARAFVKETAEAVVLMRWKLDEARGRYVLADPITIPRSAIAQMHLVSSRMCGHAVRDCMKENRAAARALKRAA